MTAPSVADRPAAAAPAPSSALARWAAAARPKTLPLALTPVVAGIGLAWAQTGRLSLGIGAATLLAAVAIQAGTNLHNDAADFERGADTPDRQGPPRASAQGWLSPRQVRWGAHLAFGVAFLLGGLLALHGGWPILAVGIAALICGYGYTSGPRPIAYGPFGELYVLAFFGVAAVAGSHYLQTLELAPSAVLLGVALGLPAAGVLMLNNYRDLETDSAAGRRTLCRILGRPWARHLYAALLALPVAILILGGLPGLPWLTAGALPLGTALVSRLYRGALGAAINPMLALTALYQAAIALLALVGLVLGGAS